MENKKKRAITKINLPTQKCTTKVKLRSHPYFFNIPRPKTLSIFRSSLLSEECPSLLAPDFYQVDALDLAPRLLGKHLKKDDVVLQITEVEAYRPNDSACHGRFGITARTAPVFGAGGHAYVYLCYGLHNMLNVVADKEGNGAAVLIRSCAPVHESVLKTGPVVPVQCSFALSTVVVVCGQSFVAETGLSHLEGCCFLTVCVVYPSVSPFLGPILHFLSPLLFHISKPKQCSENG